MTIEQIREALHKIDLMLRPQIIFIHPDDYATVMREISDIQERVVLVPTKAIDKGCAVLMDRKWLED